MYAILYASEGDKWENSLNTGFYESFDWFPAIVCYAIHMKHFKKQSNVIVDAHAFQNLSSPTGFGERSSRNDVWREGVEVHCRPLPKSGRSISISVLSGALENLF